MLALISLLTVFAFSLLIIRIGAIALTMTGVSREVAAFQALSAFSGAGFTTGESENVVSSPARRKIIALLIRLGSVGVITAVSSLVLSFAGAQGPTPLRLALLFGGVVGLLLLARSHVFNRTLTPVIARALKRYTTLDLHDYAALLHLREDYRVVEVDAEPGNWLTRSSIGELALAEEGVLVLGIVRRSGEYIGAPTPERRIEAGDQAVVYGRAGRILELSRRSVVDEEAHERAKQDHRVECEQQPK
jgi:hypothetical protein